MYRHKWISGKDIDLAAGKVVCVGRNYLDHIRELGNAVPEQALLFIKPSTTLHDMQLPLRIPTGFGECHNELEVALLIAAPLSGDSLSDKAVLAAIGGVGLGLDLTLRDVQNSLKQSGQPWERAKAFDASCPLTPFVPFEPNINLQDLQFSLTINGQTRQQGDTAMMMRPAVALIKEIASLFSLQPGDVVMTGTPKGVGPLNHGDKLTAELTAQIIINTEVT